MYPEELKSRKEIQAKLAATVKTLKRATIDAVFAKGDKLVEFKKIVWQVYCERQVWEAKSDLWFAEFKSKRGEICMDWEGLHAEADTGYVYEILGSDKETHKHTEPDAPTGGEKLEISMSAVMGGGNKSGGSVN